MCLISRRVLAQRKKEMRFGVCVCASVPVRVCLCLRFLCVCVSLCLCAALVLVTLDFLVTHFAQRHARGTCDCDVAQLSVPVAAQTCPARTRSSNSDWLATVIGTQLPNFGSTMVIPGSSFGTTRACTNVAGLATVICTQHWNFTSTMVMPGNSFGTNLDQ